VFQFLSRCDLFHTDSTSSAPNGFGIPVVE
jgi:hypothetical protein